MSFSPETPFPRFNPTRAWIAPYRQPCSAQGINRCSRTPCAISGLYPRQYPRRGLPTLNRQRMNGCASTSGDDAQSSSRQDSNELEDLGWASTSPSSDLHARTPSLVPRLQELSVGAEAATEAERRMTFLAGCRLYPKAIAWSVLVSSAIIMEAYDKSLVSFFFGFPEFRRAFGNPVEPNASHDRVVFEISSAWQSGLVNASVVGEIIGLFVNGSFTDWIGYRPTSIGAVVWLAGWIFLAFFASNIQMLLASQVLSGRSCKIPALRIAQLTDDRYYLGGLPDPGSNICCRCHACHVARVSFVQYQYGLATGSILRYPHSPRHNWHSIPNVFSYSVCITVGLRLCTSDWSPLRSREPL